MGNAGSNGGGAAPGHRRRSSGHGHGHHHQAPPPPPPQETAPNRYVFAAATPYPPQYPNPNPPQYYPQYGNYYPRPRRPCRCLSRRRTTTTTGRPPPPAGSSLPRLRPTPTTTLVGLGGIPPTDRICLCRRPTSSTRRPSLSAMMSTSRRRRFGLSLMKSALAASSSPSPLTPRSPAGDYSLHL